MHLSTVVSSLVLAAVVAASPAPLTSAGTAVAQCYSGCSAGVPVFTPQVGFSQGPVTFTSTGTFTSITTFTSSMSVFATACSQTVSTWQSTTSIQSSIQLVHQQFQYAIISMATLFAPFQTQCGICVQSQAALFTQTATVFIVQIQSMVSFIYTQFGSQLYLFRQEFSAITVLFQTFVQIGVSMNVNMQQIFINNGFDFNMFNACGVQTSSWFQQQTFFSQQHAGLLAQVLQPILQGVGQVVQGVGNLLGGLGQTVGSLLNGVL